MQFPCETIVRDVLPAFKAYIVKELFNNYKYSQVKIANLLNITQASVSYYLAGERGSVGADLIEKHQKIKEILLNLTKEIATESTNTDIIVSEVCNLCFAMHNEFGCNASDKK